MMYWKYNMLKNNKQITPYNQISIIDKLHNCCILDKNPADIKSLYFVFDQCLDVIPNNLIFDDGYIKTDYCHCKIIKIVDDSSLNNNYDTVDINGTFLYHYNSDYVKEKFSHLCLLRNDTTTLIDRYIIDWNSSSYILNSIKNNSDIEYIQCYYWIEDASDVE